MWPKIQLAAWGMCLALAAPRIPAAAPPVATGPANLTGLPAYPNLSNPVMDRLAHTDVLGRWCTRFSANTGDSLDAVAVWYHRILATASETDLTHDRRYAGYPLLAGLKLAVGIDFVAVFKVTSQAPTTIELYRCSPVT